MAWCLQGNHVIVCAEQIGPLLSRRTISTTYGTLPTSSQFWEMIENKNIFYVSENKLSTTKVKTKHLH